MTLVVRVPSLSTPGKDYEVQRDGEDMRCDCIRYETSPRPKSCSHTALVRRADGLLQRCAETHGLREPPGLCRSCVVALLALATAHVRKGYVTREEAKARVAKARKPREFWCRYCATVFSRPGLRIEHELEHQQRGERRMR